MSLLLDAVVKPSLVLLLVLAAMPLLRKRSAALRHAVLSAALLGAAAVPVAGRLVPAWHVPVASILLGERVRTPADDVVATETVIVPGGAEKQHGVARGDAQAARGALPDVPQSLGVWIWLIGSIPAVAILIAGIRQLVRLAASARRIETGTWVTSAAVIGREYGFTRDVTLLEAPSSNLLITWGFVRPTVLLPAAARDWPEDRVAVVPAHELAHIRRGDWIVLLMAELLRAIYWFNPLFWVASALTRQESERACDDRVLNRGVPGSEYATHLVGIARALRQKGTWLPAPAIARTSSLEGRVKAMLDARLNRRPLTRTTGTLTLSALLAVTMAVAGFAPAQTAFASLSGSIVDPQNAALPGVTLVLTSLQNESTYEVKSNASGHYEFVGLPPGEYAASVKLPGFATVGFPVSMAGQNVRRDLKLQIGLIEETITVSTDPPAPVDSERQRFRQERQAELVAKRTAEGCSNSPSQFGTPIGGNVRPPIKLEDMRPVYPAQLKEAGIGGLVVLDANIGTDGSVTRVEVVSSPHPDLASSAADAVRQWLFDSTLLNCVPIDVRMKVSVTFKQTQ